MFAESCLPSSWAIPRFSGDIALRGLIILTSESSFSLELELSSEEDRDWLAARIVSCSFMKLTVCGKLLTDKLGYSTLRWECSRC
jgi:hypothetical protein